MHENFYPMLFWQITKNDTFIYVTSLETVLQIYNNQNWSIGRFVDGESYFDSVADALESAEEEIFLTGWW